MSRSFFGLYLDRDSAKVPSALSQVLLQAESHVSQLGRLARIARPPHELRSMFPDSGRAAAGIGAEAIHLFLQRGLAL